MKDLNLRHEKIQKELLAQNIDAMLITSNANIFYLTGRVINGYIYVPAKGNIITFAVRPLGLSDVVYIRKPENIPEELLRLGLKMPLHVMLEEDVMPVSEWQRLTKLFKGADYSSCSLLMRKVRSVKTPYEVDIIRKTAEIHGQFYNNIPLLYKEGMTDLEYSVEIEKSARLEGHIGLFRTYGYKMEAHMGTVLTGNNAAYPSPYDFSLGGAGVDSSYPLGVSGKKISKGESIMVDMSFNNRGYLTDMTRVFSKGKLTDKAYRAHKVALNIQELLEDRAKPGAVCSALFDLAYEMVKKEGLEDIFMGLSQRAKFVGHGLGIEINEPPVLAPRINTVLEENMVIALEPKFVIENVGAVGIENTFLVTKGGLEKLTVCEEKIIEI